jgi:hypothetical protein
MSAYLTMEGKWLSHTITSFPLKKSVKKESKTERKKRKEEK